MLHVDDRLGGRPISVKKMEDARQWLALGEATEMKTLGPNYTWSNKQDGGARIFSKLDKVFSNESWNDVFPLAVAYAQWDVVSDHCYLQIKQVDFRRLGVKPFWFYNMWVAYDKVRETALQKKEAQQDYFRHEKIYASFLRQKSKITWLRFGDENSSYFHASLKQRKISNRIVSYIDADGQFVDDYDKVVDYYFQHFKTHLGSASTATGQIDPDCRIPPLLNDTIISLIPKVDQPTNATEFRPIACCNSIYKCISKMLCNRLAVVLPSLINLNQGAFIKHRSLAYNVLIFQDLIKGYNRKNRSPRCAMKLDLSKAYDTIDWDFLENLLNMLCFPSQFIYWIMVCLRGSSYSLVLNGRIQGKFKGGKGLRQGDPISPLLFVIVMEYLTRLLIKASMDNRFRFHPMCKSLTLISLCFAGDLIIFYKGTTSSVQVLLEVFSEFGCSSGLKINYSKSHIYFGGVPAEIKARILDYSKLVEGTFLLKYLGVPLRPTKWKTTNCFKKIRMCLNSVVKDIDRTCHQFLWGESGSRSKLHFTSWEQVCRPKSFGGLGFREGPIWNKLLLAKYIWAIESKQDQLWVKWVNCIYLKGFLSSERIAYERPIWCKLSVPKRRFILWQAINQHLLTRDLLFSHHIPVAYRNACYFVDSCFTVFKVDQLIRHAVKARVLNITSRHLSTRERQMIEFVKSL
ncbi:uncharacterized protein LOC133832382 [Humulus lupulus]|uniref:uncharacterized protein LOC133832382 n=1 Tax=Humulus lupulus TaxID=3486 RepID=UPI002B400CE0|nr:uncharacterized protein LOC133832382 [Humulus lupulus]